jgi:hypothetical protein
MSPREERVELIDLVRTLAPTMTDSAKRAWQLTQLPMLEKIRDDGN